MPRTTDTGPSFSRREALRSGALGTAALTLGVGAGFGTAGAQQSCTTVVNAGGGGDFTDLQTAIDQAASGDTICVEPGTYTGTVTVDVQGLTLRSTEPTGAVIAGGDSQSGAALVVSEPGVTVTGFDVTFDGGLIGIAVEPGADGATLTKNRVTDLGPTGNVAVTGILVRADVTGLRIVNNVVEGLEQTGFGNEAQGILFQPGDGDTVSQAEVVSNTIRDIESEYSSLGVTANADLADVTLQGNEIAGLTSTQVGAFDFSQGINVSGDTTDVDVIRNTVRDVAADSIVPEAVKIDGDGSGLTFRRNDLLAAIGLNNRNGESGVPTVDARCNWWGSDEGPEEAADNSSADTGDDRRDVVGPVTYTPWLTGPHGEPGSGCNGGRGRPDNPGQGPPGNGPGR